MSGWPHEIRRDLLQRTAVRRLCDFSRGWTGVRDPRDLKRPGRHVCRGVPQTPTGFTVRPQGVRWIAPKERQRGTAFPAARSCDWWPTNGTAWLRVAQGFTGKGKGLAFGRAGLYGGETRTVLRGGRHKVGDGEAGLAFGRHGGTRACVCMSACVCLATRARRRVDVRAYARGSPRRNR
jgi:hypothetical protein